MNKPKVSIIVPVYKVEKYLTKCLNSILNQTLKDIEIIILDEGDLDVCRNIIDYFEKKDSRIKAIHIKNGGYGEACNKGLEKATGEYIGFVDADDWIEPNMFEVLYNTAKKQDVEVVKSNFFEYYSKDSFRSKFREVLPPKDYNQVLCPMERLEIFRSMPCIWSAIYKKDFILKNKIDFKGSFGVHYKDTGFNFKVWASAERVYFIKDAFLHYRLDNENSSVNSKSNVFSVCEQYREIEAFLDNNLEKKKILEELKNRIKYSSYLWNFKRLSGKNKKQFLRKMSTEFKQTLKNKKAKREMFSKIQWKDYNLIAKHPVIFWFKYKMAKV